MNKQKKVLIVRLDAIGDYVLFRTLLRELRYSDAFKQTHITLLGNRLWRNLFETFDADLADACIWVNPWDYTKKSFDNLFPYIWRYRPALLWKRHQLRARLCEARFDLLVLPAIHRHPYMEELFDGVAPEMWGVAVKRPLATDRLFKYLAPAQDPTLFTFIQNRLAMEAFTGKKVLGVNRPAPFVPTVKKGNFVVLFPGASHWTRCWPTKRFAKVAQFIIDTMGLEVIITGGKNDIKRAQKIERLVARPQKIRNEAGQGTLADMAHRIAGARMVISNDTCAVHFGAVQCVPTLCITNGISGRNLFWPYPGELGLPVHALIPERFGIKEKGLIETQIRYYLNVLQVSVNDVIAQITQRIGKE